MRLDWELARRGYRRYAAYPAATWAGILTNSVFGFIQAYVLLAMYDDRDDIGGYDAADALCPSMACVPPRRDERRTADGTVPGTCLV